MGVLGGQRLSSVELSGTQPVYGNPEHPLSDAHSGTQSPNQVNQSSAVSYLVFFIYLPSGQS